MQVEGADSFKISAPFQKYMVNKRHDQHTNVVSTLNNLYNVMLKTTQTELFTQLKNIQKKKAMQCTFHCLHNEFLKCFCWIPLPNFSYLVVVKGMINAAWLHACIWVPSQLTCTQQCMCSSTCNMSSLFRFQA